MKRFVLIAAFLAFATQAEAASRFWVGGTGTWDASTTTHWSTGSGGAGGASVPGSADSVTFDGASGGGTVTVATNVSITTFTTSAFTGTIDFATNNNTMTMSGTWTDTASGVHTINVGTGLWTTTGNAANQINITAGANLTLNATTGSSLSVAPTNNPLTSASTISCGGHQFGNISFTFPATTSRFNMGLGASACTMNNLTVTGNGLFSGVSGNTYTVNGSVTFTGIDAGHMLFVGPGTLGNTITLTVANSSNTSNYVAINSIANAGAGTITLNNATDLGANTGVTVNPPSGGRGIIGG